MTATYKQKNEILNSYSEYEKSFQGDFACTKLPPPPLVRDTSTDFPSVEEMLIELAYQYASLNDWERSFCESINEKNDSGYNFTDRQMSKLEKLYTTHVLNAKAKKDSL